MSRHYRRLTVVIPAYNETRTIDRILTAVKQIDLRPLGLEREIVVVDDGSVDDTSAIIRDKHPDVVLISHFVNQGKGNAIRTALQRATGDIILIQDADLEYDPNDYPALLQPIVDGQAQVVFGSRFLDRAYPRRMHLSNFVANRVLTLLSNALYGLHITDEATCYKVFDGDLLRGLRLRCQEFEFCPEVIALLGRQKIPVVEVPVRYVARTNEEGKKIGWLDGVQAVRTLVGYRWKRLPKRDRSFASRTQPDALDAAE
ncbi:MAG TPA: glycosyltransferase family 2 protein [Polyangia bacterium]|jgi:glycosyltransferase involved in cell wall biosynthesis|nr:glycosyltransferase family 2 protein [Polyangia bacterium]